MKKECAKKVIRRAVTLIEMLVVMALIAIITGALAYNYRGALTTGKAFKERQIKDKISTILSIEIAQDHAKKADVASGWKDILKKSNLWAGPTDDIKKADGSEFAVSCDNDEVIVK